MIFAFLFGLSMDYEVFMLTRMREAYDETGSTDRAIELGLSRTGKLVTSAALILMFAFLVLSSSPGYEIKVVRDRPRRRDHLRRHRDPRAARAGADEAPRRRELVDARVDAHRAPHPRPGADTRASNREGIAERTPGVAATLAAKPGVRVGPRPGIVGPGLPGIAIPWHCAVSLSSRSLDSRAGTTVRLNW